MTTVNEESTVGIVSVTVDVRKVVRVVTPPITVIVSRTLVVKIMAFVTVTVVTGTSIVVEVTNVDILTGRVTVTKVVVDVNTVVVVKLDKVVCVT